MSKEAFAAKKVSIDEAAERDIPEEEWPDWRQAEAEESELAKIAASGAVKVLTPAESAESNKVLRGAGARRSLGPGDRQQVCVQEEAKRADWRAQHFQKPMVCSRRSRPGCSGPECVLTYRHDPELAGDPSAGSLLKDAWDLRRLEATFTQSDRLQRAAGKLYVRQSRGGLPGMEPEVVMEVIVGVYGLVDGWTLSCNGGKLSRAMSPRSLGTSSPGSTPPACMS